MSFFHSSFEKWYRFQKYCQKNTLPQITGGMSALFDDEIQL
ncbi:hypothetical protein CHCC20335_0537 [Bacillus paralicheniformis]|nr:hypothetical protein CHCC20335_0537 [Bacillus paralicheniformis]TWN06247.1 hypothetical protein CHCC14566_3430 [Bacillus licheniformis]